MWTLNKYFALIFIIQLAAVSCESNASELVNMESNMVDTNPARTVVLTQLQSTKSTAGGAIYTYKCTVGTYRSNRLACASRDSTSWPSPHNVEVKLRCPNSGSGLTLSYVEIIYSVSSQSVNCYVNEGAVGLGYIGLTINAWNTLLFTYSANFYTY